MDSVLASSAHPHRAVTPAIGGVDEAGRGCLAGPVVAACVVLSTGVIASEEESFLSDAVSSQDARLPSLIRDSKKLTPRQREEACRWLYRYARAVSVGLATVEEIERLNILQASLLAMRRAVEGCPLPLQMVLVDGSQVPDGLHCPAVAVVDGDERVSAISAASIVAKVVRDHLMERLHHLYPRYDFARHKGYGTPHHRRAIAQFGLCPQHRRSFCANVHRLPFGSDDG